MSVPLVEGETLGDQTIIVHKPGTAGTDDAYGNPTRGPEVLVSVPGCRVEPFRSRNTSETMTPTQDLVSSKWMMYVPYGTVINSNDWIETPDGLRLQVDGRLMCYPPEDDFDGHCETYLIEKTG